MTFRVPRGTPTHDHLCDAVLEWGGFVILGDVLHEILFAAWDRESDAFDWAARPARYAGSA